MGEERYKEIFSNNQFFFLHINHGTWTKETHETRECAKTLDA